MITRNENEAHCWNGTVDVSYVISLYKGFRLEFGGETDGR